MIGHEDNNGAVTKAFFLNYMENFLRKLREEFVTRDVCVLRHQAIDGRLKSSEEQFAEVNKRLKSIETRLLIGIGAFMAFQFALQNGWLVL